MAVYVLDVCLASLAVYLVVRRAWSSGPPFPPGPRGWPLIGNLLDLRAEAPYKTIGAMTSKYGPVIYLNALGTRLVFLNSFKTTKDLLEKKSAFTSNRPHLTVASDLVGWGSATAFLQYDATHRKHRKFLGRHIRANRSLVTFYPVEEAEARRFVRNLLEKPDDLIAHCRMTATALVLKISHGYSVKDDRDPIAEVAHNALHTLPIITSPAGFLSDLLPILRYLPDWLPGGGLLGDVMQWRKSVSDALNMPYEFVLENPDDAAPSFIGQLLQESVTAEDEEIFKWIAFAMYLAGSETTPSMLSAFFLAMTMYPEVLKKAQAEVDAVVGSERLPTMQDRDALPYVKAICTELLRWNLLAPMPSHASTQDIIYEGYFIPKGSWLVPNTWFILSNPETYPNPEIFDPERFLGEHQQPDPRQACFGWGRRFCPGAHLAESIIFIYVTTSLTTLDVSRYVESGMELVPKYEFEEGMIRHLKPFKCKITPRSKVDNLLQA